MTHLIRGLVLALAAVLLSGCSDMVRPSPVPSGDQAPVNLRQLQIQSIDGHAALLLRLSRIPDSLRHSAAAEPGQIIIEAEGPEGESDLDERSLGQSDALISDVRVSRSEGLLRIVVEFRGAQPPSYSVHQMADWVMVRLGGATS